MALWDFLLTVKGTDLQTLGFSPGVLQGLMDSPAESSDETNVPLREGTKRTSLVRTVEPRDGHVTGELSGATESAFVANRDQFLYLLSFENVAVLLGMHDDRQLIGSLKGKVAMTPPTQSGDGFTSADVDFTLHFEDPVWRAVTASTPSGAANTDIACPLGTRRVYPITTATVSGTPASITITYKNHAGTTIGVPLVLAKASGTFANADVVAVDHNLMTVTLNGARRDDLITAGDFIALDPRDGDPFASEWPTVRATQALALSYHEAFQ